MTKSEKVNRINDLLKQVSDQNQLILAKCNDMLTEAKPEKLQESVNLTQEVDLVENIPIEKSAKVAEEVGHVKRLAAELQYGIFEEAMDWIPGALSLYYDLASIHSAQLDVLMCDSCDDGNNVCGLCKVKEKLDAKVSQLLQYHIKWGKDVRDVDFHKYLDRYCCGEGEDCDGENEQHLSKETGENEQHLFKVTQETEQRLLQEIKEPNFRLEDERVGAVAEGDPDGGSKTSKTKMIAGAIGVALLIALVTGAFMKRKDIQQKFLELRQLLLNKIKKPEESEALNVQNVIPKLRQMVLNKFKKPEESETFNVQNAIPKLRQMVINKFRKPEEPEVQKMIPNLCEIFDHPAPAGAAAAPTPINVGTHERVQLLQKPPMESSMKMETLQIIQRPLQASAPPQKEPTQIIPSTRRRLNLSSGQKEDLRHRSQLLNRMMRDKAASEVCPFSIMPSDTPDLESMGFFKKHLTKQQQCFKSILGVFNLKKLCF